MIELRGEMDGSAQGVLDEAYARVESWGVPAVLLDFSGVGYINSKGIALIVGLLRRARRSSTRVLATGLSDHYLEIFDITRLSDYIGIYPNEESALRDATSRREAIPAQPPEEPAEAR
ncbi:MAG: STAS domain-containing protein [Anaerolineae bacterium]|nr:STAS domain-containing protein [Anaerolineae bacterium]